MNRVKLVLPMGQLKHVRRWLVDNCKQRWTAADYAYKTVNWRVLARVPDDAGFKITTWIDFTKREDMMLFLMAWPGEVAVLSTNEQDDNTRNDKYPCYTKVTPVSNLLSA